MDLTVVLIEILTLNLVDVDELFGDIKHAAS